MQGISVAVVGGGRWARALAQRLSHNQNNPSGHTGFIRRVMRYQPPADLPRLATLLDPPEREKPAQKPAASARSGGDATVQISADALLFATGEIYGDTVELDELAEADLIILAVPAAKVKALLETLGGVLTARQCLVHAIGSFAPIIGISGQNMMPVSELVKRQTRLVHIGVLAGPALAEDLEEEVPVALACGSASSEVNTLVHQALHRPLLRVYPQNDIIGVELSRALIGVMAIACGVADALGFGSATRAVLVGAGVSEMARLGVALGASERTFYGAAGIGELIVATERRGSPDFQLGKLLGHGASMGDASRQIDRACDGLNMVREAHVLAQGARLSLPIIGALYRWVSGKMDLRSSMIELLERELRG
jgi:glycerol-3-phosphate dehydrogenase (NAD(P)+)